MARAEPLEGKVCVVTGATSGIGRAAAAEFARMGATVVLVGRNAESGNLVLGEIRAGASEPDRLSFIRADFAALGEVGALSERLHERFDRIDVLVNNAGRMNDRRRVSLDGYEETLAVNHLAPFALTGLVLDLLLAAPAARVVNVASDAHLRGRIDLTDLQRTRRCYMGYPAYAASKLANLQFTFELARRLERTRVTVNAVHPGLVASGFERHGNWPTRLVYRLLRPFMLTAEQGADSVVWAATAPELAGVTGRYFARRRQEATSRAARDIAAQQSLWAASEKLVGFFYPALVT